MSETSDESRVPKYLNECIQIIHGQSQESESIIPYLVGLEHFLFLHILGRIYNPNWLSYFSEGYIGIPPSRILYWQYWLMNNTISQLYHIIRVWYNVILLYTYYTHIIHILYHIIILLYTCFIASRTPRWSFVDRFKVVAVAGSSSPLQQPIGSTGSTWSSVRSWKAQGFDQGKQRYISHVCYKWYNKWCSKCIADIYIYANIWGFGFIFILTIRSSEHMPSL